MTHSRFDVAILGSGIAGSVLGAILAKNGASVLLVDGGVHPRFAVGESTTLYTLNMFRVLAERYGVPELANFLTTDACYEHIGPTFGTKRNFGFMIHREGEEPDPREVNQFSPPSLKLQTSHLHRQDSDTYLFHTAIKYGCVARQGLRVTGVNLGDDEVEITGQGGERFTARYLVDASGFRSPLATQLGLRAEPSALKHHSRSLFTHMLDVRPTDECLDMPQSEMPPIPWEQGTMHHLIERGWFWIIPFNNDPRSKNPLVSVGLTFDERVYPKPSDMTPEEEFHHHVSRYPVLERIFADAKTVRPWVSTDRIQYTSTKTVGHRWCLMSHAAGFIDPLYSRGLTNTGEVINSLAWRLLEALQEDDFSQERFAYIDELQSGLIKYNDEMVNCSFISFSDYELWNAVCRVWAAAEIPINLRFERFLDRYQASGDDNVFREMEKAPYPGSFVPDNAAYQELFAEMVRLCEAVDRSERDATEAGRELMKLVQESEAVLPFIGLDERDHRFIYPQPPSLMKLFGWLGTEGPEEMRYLATLPGGGHFPPGAPR
ncbi:NAD(P)/FAD-dependent oxidoreductase [Planomonospora venezuelensis]|uniref:FADH2 O2-dependent halogenase n=1 Tax=Planomonospora venezuelensis TaxID=1999 RepID=A0A841CWY5_PLAVE|nr:tryptophan 7-halogenase [Planomonospora venezuelensis]MBB5962431.1 FADH2 O2-dependent halogenase [Planomonospora venezuelensis]GIN00813.1 halogenase [Planomonospora venezuelensis]